MSRSLDGGITPGQSVKMGQEKLPRMRIIFRKCELIEAEPTTGEVQELNFLEEAVLKIQGSIVIVNDSVAIDCEHISHELHPDGTHTVNILAKPFTLPPPVEPDQPTFI